MTADILCDNVVKRYGSVAALDGLDLQVREAEMHGLIGPDGAGKTTLLRILCGLLFADSGRIRLADHDPRTQSRALRAFLGYMPQRFSLYPDLTVTENLRFFADLFQVKTDEREKRLQRLLSFSRLGPFSERKASALSGGMKQKLALSCTLIHTPRILLLDEPTTGVDPVSRREFWDILAEMRGEGVTILVSTPYMDEAARCDRISFIHKGKVLVTDAPANIPGLYRQQLLEVRTTENVAAARVIQADGGFSSVQVFGDRIHVSAAGDAASMRKRVQACLQQHHISIEEMRPVPATIEDVFVELLR